MDSLGRCCIVEIRRGGDMMVVMDVRLLVAHPSVETKQIWLGAETLIGRGVECKLRISSGQVSRRHCLIKVAGTSVTVRDLGSANGTRLNGLPILTETDVPILPGSTLGVGPLKFVVQFAAPRTAADDETEWLSGLATVAKSSDEEYQDVSTAPIVDGEETKDYLPSKRRRQGDARPGTVAHDGSQPASTDGLVPKAVKPVESAEAEDAAETHLLFEEDDLQRLAAEVESATKAGGPAGPQSAGTDAAAAAEEHGHKPPAGAGLLGFLRRKKQPAEGGPAPPADSDDNDDELRKFLSDV